MHGRHALRLVERRRAARAALRRAAGAQAGRAMRKRAVVRALHRCLGRRDRRRCRARRRRRHGARGLGRLGAVRRRLPARRRSWAWASFTPNSPLFGRVVTGRGTNDRVLALTFDDGPSAEWTPQRARRAARARRARDVLRARPPRRARTPSSSRRIRDEGHEIASHGYDHALLTFASQADVDRQLERTEISISRGARRRAAPALFRAPHGFRNPFVHARDRRGAAIASSAGRRACGTPPSRASRRSCAAPIVGFRPGRDPAAARRRRQRRTATTAARPPRPCPRSSSARMPRATSS